MTEKELKAKTKKERCISYYIRVNLNMNCDLNWNAATLYEQRPEIPYTEFCLATKFAYLSRIQYLLDKYLVMTGKKKERPRLSKFMCRLRKDVLMYNINVDYKVEYKNFLQYISAQDNLTAYAEISLEELTALGLQVQMTFDTEDEDNYEPGDVE